MKVERYEPFRDSEQKEIEFKGRMIFVDIIEEGVYDLKNTNPQDPACNSTLETTIEQVAWQSYNVSSQGLNDKYFVINENDKNWKRLEKWCPELIKKINLEIF